MEVQYEGIVMTEEGTAVLYRAVMHDLRIDASQLMEFMLLVSAAKATETEGIVTNNAGMMEMRLVGPGFRLATSEEQERHGASAFLYDTPVYVHPYGRFVGDQTLYGIIVVHERLNAVSDPRDPTGALIDSRWKGSSPHLQTFDRILG